MIAGPDVEEVGRTCGSGAQALYRLIGFGEFAVIVGIACHQVETGKGVGDDLSFYAFAELGAILDGIAGVIGVVACDVVDVDVVIADGAAETVVEDIQLNTCFPLVGLLGLERNAVEICAACIAETVHIVAEEGDLVLDHFVYDAQLGREGVLGEGACGGVGCGIVSAFVFEAIRPQAQHDVELLRDVQDVGDVGAVGILVGLINGVYRACRQGIYFGGIEIIIGCTRVSEVDNGHIDRRRGAVAFLVVIVKAYDDAIAQTGDMHIAYEVLLDLGAIIGEILYLYALLQGAVCLTDELGDIAFCCREGARIVGLGFPFRGQLVVDLTEHVELAGGVVQGVVGERAFVVHAQVFNIGDLACLCRSEADGRGGVEGGGFNVEEEGEPVAGFEYKAGGQQHIAGEASILEAVFAVEGAVHPEEGCFSIVEGAIDVESQAIEVEAGASVADLCAGGLQWFFGDAVEQAAEGDHAAVEEGAGGAFDRFEPFEVGGIDVGVYETRDAVAYEVGRGEAPGQEGASALVVYQRDAGARYVLEDAVIIGDHLFAHDLFRNDGVDLGVLNIFQGHTGDVVRLFLIEFIMTCGDRHLIQLLFGDLQLQREGGGLIFLDGDLLVDGGMAYQGYFQLVGAGGQVVKRELALVVCQGSFCFNMNGDVLGGFAVAGGDGAGDGAGVGVAGRSGLG